jgi:trans-aconitate methyltransferase
MKWNPRLYDHKHNFVYEYGKTLIDILKPSAHESILDLGCGTGVLTKAIAESGAEVMGIDKSPEMVAQAQEAFPELVFLENDAANFQLPQKFDAICSNATLHWVLEVQEAANCMYKHLKPGGRLIAEFGGAGNVQNIVNALRGTLTEKGYHRQAGKEVWYFPTADSYRKVLLQSGFRVDYCALHPRPTTLVDQSQGMADWLRMFGQAFFENIETASIEEIIDETQSKLKPTNYINHQWVADYVRLRVVAFRESH